jgi:hypothetical protein
MVIVSVEKMGIQGIDDAFIEIQNKNGAKLKDGIGQLKQQFKQIERSIKVVNGLSNSEIVNQIEVFSDNVESTQSIKEGEKILLVHAVKQFKEILTEINNLNQLPQIC